VAKVSTDKGGEFSKLNENAGIAHATKAVSDPNGIAVLDRAMQTLKKDISSDLVDGEHKYWDDALEPVTDAYNNRPHSTTIVPPSEVENNGHAQFKLLQKNASNFAVNRSQTLARTAQVKEAGAFRAYEPNSRSFNPQWGKAFNVKSVKGDQVTNTSGKSFPLKQVQAVPRGSTEAIGKLTDNTLSRKARFQERANDVVDMLAGRGSQMSLVEFERAIRANAAEGLIKVLRKANMTIRGFIRLYPELFTMRSGVVKLKTQPAEPAAEPAAEAEPEPAAEPVRRRRLTLVGGGDPAAEARVEEALRRQRASARLQGMNYVYGTGPRI
jgi:hypothetical protein